MLTVREERFKYRMGKPGMKPLLLDYNWRYKCEVVVLIERKRYIHTYRDIYIHIQKSRGLYSLGLPRLNQIKSISLLQCSSGSLIP